MTTAQVLEERVKGLDGRMSKVEREVKTQGESIVSLKVSMAKMLVGFAIIIGVIQVAIRFIPIPG